MRALNRITKKGVTFSVSHQWDFFKRFVWHQSKLISDSFWTNNKYKREFSLEFLERFHIRLCFWRYIHLFIICFCIIEHVQTCRNLIHTNAQFSVQTQILMLEHTYIIVNMHNALFHSRRIQHVNSHDRSRM